MRSEGTNFVLAACVALGCGVGDGALVVVEELEVL